MAKNKIKIDVEVDDNGNLKAVGNKAKKAAKDMDDLGNRSGVVDRNLKGVAGASSNATKNFSKMSQGMGGLLGAYANLAASLFAISAAFNFLKSAGDLKVLEASQKAYAANTGVAMRVLANDIVSATNAQINFQDAAQAAAIGTAAGLNPGQLNALGKAASDLSVSLGRDVTDSFNRLIRGVTKAEPELLDELGIILRLKDAQEEYGRMIGKSANELTQFEKSQAVANKVLQEASRVAGQTPPGVVNPYNQLGKAFDDILIKIKGIADAVAGPLASVLTRTPSLAIAAFGLLLTGPLKALGFNFKEIASNASDSAKVQSAAAAKAREAYKNATLSIKEQTAAIRAQAAAAVQAGSSSKILQTFSTPGATMTPQAKATLKKALDAAEAQYKTHTKIVSGIFKGMDIQIVRDFQLSMKQLDVAEKSKEVATKSFTLRMRAYWATATAGVRVFTAAVMTAGIRLVSFFGWVGIAVTAVSLLAEYFGFYKKEVEDSESATDKLSDRLNTLNGEYKDFLDTQTKLAKAGRGAEVLSNIADQSSMLSTDDFLTTVKLAQSYNGLLEKRNKIVASGVRSIQRGSNRRAVTNRIKEAKEETEAEILRAKAAKEFIQVELDGINMVTKLTGMKSRAAEEYKRVLQDTNSSSEDILKARNNFQAVGNTIKELPRLLTDAQAATSDWVQSLAPLSRGDIALQNIQLALDAINRIARDGTVISEEQLKEQRALSAQKKLIIKFEKQLFDQKVAALNLDLQQELSMRNVNKIIGERVKLNYDILRNDQAILDKQIALDNLLALVQSKKDATPSEVRTIALLTQEIYLLGVKGDTLKENESILASQEPNRLLIQSIELNSEILKQSKELLNVRNTQVVTQKQLLNAEISLAKVRAEMSERATNQSSRFSFLREEQRIAEANYQIELNMIGQKINQVTSEFAIKKEMVSLEFVLLDAKLRVSELELRNKALAAGLEQEQINAYIALADATKAQRLAASNTLGPQLELLSTQQQLEIETLINNLAGLDRVRQDLGDINVILDEMAETLFSEMSSALDSLITRTEGSLKDATLSLFQNLGRALSKSISDLITTQILEMMTKKFGGVLDPLTNAANKGATQVAGALQSGATKVRDKILEAFTRGAQILNQPKQDTAAKVVEAFVGPTEKGKETSNDFFQNVFGSLGSSKPTPTASRPAPTGIENEILVTGKRGGPIASTFANIFSMENPLIKGLQNIFSKSNPLLQGLGGIFGKLFSGLGSLLGGAGGGIASLFTSFLGFANGGMVKGGFRAYANGGIATKPTIGLVGEGKYNEAIVPMPNGKAIPVDMKGSQGQNNNITINIDSAGGATTSGMSDQDNKQLGRAIAQAVQKELQNQKRSGGILSPYGVA